jgi:hypothetical protein
VDLPVDQAEVFREVPQTKRRRGCPTREEAAKVTWDQMIT